VGEGNLLSSGGNGGLVFIRERPDSGFDRGDNIVKGTTIRRSSNESSGRPECHATEGYY